MSFVVNNYAYNIFKKVRREVVSSSVKTNPLFSKYVAKHASILFQKSAQSKFSKNQHSIRDPSYHKKASHFICLCSVFITGSHVSHETVS